MAKLTLNTIGSRYGSIDALNDNFNAIETAIENTFSLDGTSPNALEADLDMNSNDILNAGEVSTDTLRINGVLVEPTTGVTAGAVFQTYEFTATAGQTTFSVSPATPYNASIVVIVNGLQLSPAEVSVSGTNVITPALTVGDEVVIRRYTAEPVASPDATEVNFIQAGTGAVTRTSQAKMRDVVSVKDFGAVADGIFTTGGSPSGTDNLSFFNSALAAAVSTGISRVYVPGGRYYLSGKLTLPSGIILEGDGTAWLPGFLAGIGKGTALLINGAAGNDCLAFAENTSAHSEIRDISIYNTNTNAIRSVVSVIGHLYPRMKNVEIASLRKTTGSGLYLAPSATGAQYETLWGDFDNVMVTITDVGSATEASVRWGLNIYSLTSTKVCNANAFRAGQFAGTWGGLIIDGAVSGARALSNVFHGTKFDTNWDNTYTPTFKSAAANVFGFTKANCYIYPVVRINQGDGIVFHGCYFESAGSPITYNNGVNGSASLIAVLWIDNPTNCLRTGALDSNWNSCYTFDAGLQSNIAPIAGGHRHNNQTAAALLLRQATAQSIATSSFTKIQFSNVLQGDDSNLEWDSTNYQVKIRQAGVYQISGQVAFAGWATAGTYAVSRIAAGGYNVTGTYAPQIGAGNSITTTANVCLSLITGDTIELQVLQNQGTNQALAGNESILSVVKIG